MLEVWHNGKWVEARKPEDIGRKDWHHNEKGEVDYPLFKGNPERLANQKSIPLEKQKYDYEVQASYEEGASNLVSINARKPDWDEYERFMREFN